ncbi:hypothetical protein L1049_024054 [Liquidambar formosana]|uniref:LysM domain-containing protein n=1 Tax=Liquidambar formosana TaxID=63359 RepID=A0AAP0WY59_LIQFO
MSNPRADAGDGDDRSGNDKDATVAKTAGFVVFSGIAMSILKALNPYNNKKDEKEMNSLTESTQPIQEPQSLPPREPIIPKTLTTCADQKEPESSRRTIEIVKGDTLWGLSRKYGVTIDAIKEANGLTGDTIYAGKKLIIP